MRAIARKHRSAPSPVARHRSSRSCATRLLRRTLATATATALLLPSPLLSSATALGAAERKRLEGVDVSQYQHPRGAGIDWRGVRSDGGRFVFIKATDGIPARSNAYFARDWLASWRAGMLRGAYHYARPSIRPGSAEAQARQFAHAVGDLRGAAELPPVLDLETTGGLTARQLLNWTGTWLRAVEQLTGRRPMIYTYPTFWQNAMGNTTAFGSSHQLWIADWSAKSAPQRIGGWKTWTFWQHSSTGRVSGIPALVDLNRYHGSERELGALANLHAPRSAPGTFAGDDRLPRPVEDE